LRIEHRARKIQTLIDLKKKIHLNPSWQRGPVWSPAKQALLIDSILRGYDVPMIYLRECPPSATYKYEVVDGQQRLRSIWDFIDGAYALSSDMEKVGQTSISGLEFDDLPRRLRDKIKNFKVIIAFVKNAREPEISILFSRMQMGVRLNPAELRNAIQTGLRHAIDGLARLHPFFIESRIIASRFKHQDYLAHAISACLHNGRRDLKAPQLKDDYENTLDDSIYAPVIADAYDVLDFLKKVNVRLNRRITQKWLFVDLFFLLYRNKEKLGKINIKEFSDTYAQFDDDRREYNADPGELLKGKTTKDQRDLYNYIMAFKISGGEKANLQQRNQIMARRFKQALGG